MKPNQWMRHAGVAVCAMGLSVAAHAGDFSLTSPDVAPGERIPDTFVFKGFGCEGENQAPALEWANPPEGTRSYALTVYDPDAPTGSGWWHWVVVNLPADTTGMPRGGALPASALGIGNDFGTTDYGGPCPPVGHGPHRYIFTVHALKVPSIDLPENASAALAGYMINANRLDSATFTSTYER